MRSLIIAIIIIRATYSGKGQLTRQIKHAQRELEHYHLQWATKLLRHLAIKSIFEHLRHIFPPSTPNNVDFSISTSAQTTSPTQH